MTYNQLAFALEILKLLADKPRYRSELGDILSEYLEKQGIEAKDVLQKLTRTIPKLRKCGFIIESAPHHPYVLKESNFPLILSVEQRQALYIAAYFLANMGFSAQASQIYRLGNLSQSDRPPNVKVDFNPPVDYSESHIDTLVQQLQQRIETGCYYQIRYINAQKEERKWDLGLSELRLHNGVLYLFAHVPGAPFKNFEKEPNIEQNYTFRIDRITNIYPSSGSAWFWRTFPTLSIRYRMTGSLVYYQPRRNHEKVIERNLDDKYIEIETIEDHLFWFRQRILQYGKNVQVLTPNWLAKNIAQEISLAYQNYNNLVQQ
ncbi:conserved hypothetical protein [Gloeothece citriformis PCC 7424]|uniref:WCX domain-containing protein n=1 Tax=Gloeothece citriformis (strain PCC 7424) TaxID=65393 RepID=B7KB33_GLOC7|nr:WYL domain-containing protein [Gloeothece citriformis]ACK70143.1 conserved hypothetical protein [Gloeothece citriformis PCC 7424]